MLTEPFSLSRMGLFYYLCRYIYIYISNTAHIYTQTYHIRQRTEDTELHHASFMFQGVCCTAGSGITAECSLRYADVSKLLLFVWAV
jgi:hypothetical protein